MVFLLRLAVPLILVSAVFSVPPVYGALKLVVIDPGHGGTNLGAPARFHPGRYEKHYTLILSRYVREHLVAAGVKTVLTREDDRDVTLFERIGLANRLGADVFISLHLNATEVPGPTGHETFFLALEATDEAARRLAKLESADPTAVKKAAQVSVKDEGVNAILLDLKRNQAHSDAQRLAALIQERTTPRSPFKNRGVKQAPFFVLMGASMPAVVVEIGFINHSREGRFITSDKGLRAMAAGIAAGIIDYGQLVHDPRTDRRKKP
jgi:N-acetylmuramoyl-L-alanine amidase